MLGNRALPRRSCCKMPRGPPTVTDFWEQRLAFKVAPAVAKPPSEFRKTHCELIQSWIGEAD